MIFRRNGAVDVPKESLELVRGLYEKGLYLQAYELACKSGPLEEWNGVEAQTLAGRVAGNLGGERLGRWMHHRAWRSDRSNAEACFYRAAELLSCRGPYATWRFLQKQGDFLNAPPPTRGDLIALRARTAAHFRDFDRAESWLAEAEKLGTTPGWLWCERATCLQLQDAFEAALEAAREGLRERPWFRPAVQSAGHLLQMIGKDEEALALLREAMGRLESGAVAFQLAVLEFELGLYQDSLASWERGRALSPLFSETALKWWEGRMADALYHCGDPVAAAERARRAGDEFYGEFAGRLETEWSTRRRVHLKVGFVRQHHMTCAPATLSALSNYWGVEVDHAALAEQICYDGTFDHVERHWAESNGYVVREFRVTWEAAVELLDQGIPFTLATTETTSAHLQAVIGYDSLRRSLLIRDPGSRVHQEFPVKDLLERYAAFGPRAMALVPKAQEHRLEGIAFPDAPFYDLYHQLERALHLHDRARAEAVLADMEGLDSGHRLTLFARRDLAYYDASLPRQLAAANSLLAQFPECNNFRWMKLSVLNALSRKAESGAFLRECAGAKNSDVLFWRELARELSQDARSHSQARRHALRALRWSPVDAENLSTFASLLWEERQFEAACELYRFASHTREGVENYTRQWFIAARHLRQTEETLDWLRRRFDRAGKKSSRPARTLFQSLEVLERTEEGFACLEQALALRPKDGDLLLFAADANARNGRFEKAEQLLATAETNAPRMAWLRTAATVAGYRCDLDLSLKLWSEIVKAEPLTVDAQRAVTRLIAELDGRAAALIHIRSVCERFPFHVPLHRLWIEWVSEEPAEQAEKVIRRALELDQDDAWTLRELALVLNRMRRNEEALEAARKSLAVEPLNPSSPLILAQVLLDSGRLAEARSESQKALGLSVDTRQAIPLLMNASPTIEEKRAGLQFVRKELVRQVVFGDGLIAYREAAYPVLEPEELLANLRDAHAARPDLWHAWSALIHQLLDMQRVEEALALALQAIEKFPLLPRIWYDLAIVQQSKDLKAAVAPFERALLLSPGWALPARALANTHQRLGDFEASRRVLEGAIAKTPLDPGNHGCLAEILWLLGEREAAMTRVEHGLRLEPGYDWAWNALRAWSEQSGGENRAEKLARELARERPGEPRFWHRLAQSLPEKRLEERLEALEKALDLNPRYVEALDFRAFLLARASRFEEALAACAPSSMGDEIPMVLRGRACWIQAIRGDLVAAVKSMREVVKTSPDYYWGWSALVDWLGALGKFEEALEAAHAMARLAPRNASPLATIANIQTRMGQEREACETLRRAFELDPQEEYAGRALFDRQLNAGSLKEAEKTLAILERHQPGAQTQAAKIRWLCRSKKKEEALEKLRLLCLVPEREAGAIAEAAGAFREAGWGPEAERVFSEALDRQGANPEVGAQWVASFTLRGNWGKRDRLYELDPESPLGRRARLEYLVAIGRHQHPQYLGKLLKREEAALRKDVQCWGQVGYIYTNQGLFKQAAAWGADWRERTDAKPWMLVNLALSLRSLGREDEALELNRAALRLQGDHTTPQHSLWLALEEAIQGEVDSARERLASVPTQGLVSFNQAAHVLATALVSVQSAPPDQLRSVYNEQKALLRHSGFHAAFRDPALRPTAKRAVFQMAKLAGARPFRLGSSMQLVSSRSTMPRSGGSSSWRLIPFFVFAMSGLVRTCTDSTISTPPRSPSSAIRSYPALESRPVAPAPAFPNYPTPAGRDSKLILQQNPLGPRVEMLEKPVLEPLLDKPAKN